MLAFSLSSSTCVATIPASITPSSGIQLRPRTKRSISRWSGSARMNSSARACGLGPRFRAAGFIARPLGRGAVVTLAAPPRAPGRRGPDTRRGAVDAFRVVCGGACLRTRAPAAVAGGLTRSPPACGRPASGRFWPSDWRRSRPAWELSPGGSGAQPRARGRKRKPAAREDRCSRASCPPETA